MAGIRHFRVKSHGGARCFLPLRGGSSREPHDVNYFELTVIVYLPPDQFAYLSRSSLTSFSKQLRALILYKSPTGTRRIRPGFCFQPRAMSTANINFARALLHAARDRYQKAPSPPTPPWYRAAFLRENALTPCHARGVVPTTTKSSYDFHDNESELECTSFRGDRQASGLSIFNERNSRPSPSLRDDLSSAP